MRRLKQNPICFQLKSWITNNKPITLKLVFHNIEGFLKHWRSLISDPVIFQANILLFVETWLTSKQITSNEIDNYNVQARIDHDASIPGHSSMVLTNKENVHCRQTFTTDIVQDSNWRIELIACNINNVIILNLYISPRTPKREVIHFLTNMLLQHQHSSIVICGDFNIDINHIESTWLINI